MKRSLLILSIYFGLALSAKAQLFGKKDLYLQQGIMSFHQKSLNNQSNTNKRISSVSEAGRHFNLSRFFSFQYGLGLGNQRNADTLFKPYDNSNFFRIRFGLLLHRPQKYTPSNWSPRRLNLYFKAGYTLDIMDYNWGEANGSRLCPAFGTGGGAVYRISHTLGVSYEFSHNQRVGKDYRSYFQHSIGILINLDTPHLLY